MRHQFDLLEEALGALRGAFWRERPFEWMRAFVLGPVCRPDRLGVSSAVRALGLEPESYGPLLGLFRSGAWTADSLRRRWHARLTLVERTVELGDYPHSLTRPFTRAHQRWA